MTLITIYHFTDLKAKIREVSDSTKDFENYDQVINSYQEKNYRKHGHVRNIIHLVTIHLPYTELNAGDTILS